ncbi:hypothetical protein AAC387_Pa01g4081 [Persea americana]
MFGNSAPWPFQWRNNFDDLTMPFPLPPSFFSNINGKRTGIGKQSPQAFKAGQIHHVFGPCFGLLNALVGMGIWF